MDTLFFLRKLAELMGESGSWKYFSALKVSSHFEISAYHSRKLIKSLQEAGLVQRAGNVYVLNNTGFTIAYSLAVRAQEMYVK